MLKLYRLFFLLLLASFVSANNDFDFDLIKKGKDDNNTLLVVGGIQGDEPGGFISASILATHYKITKGSVWIVPNLNFYSIIKRSRGPYGDMNRKFAHLSSNDPEYETVQRIKKYINDEKVKLIVNLHDGSGFFRPKYIDAMHTPYRWGQSSVIDQVSIDVPKYGNLKEISSEVVKHVNQHLIKKEHIYHVHNTKTVEGDLEMAKSLTYYAINNGKAAFGNEASKNLNTHYRVYYHLQALEKYMDIMGIEYKKDFELSPSGVYNAINNDIYISLYGDKIKLPLSQIRKYLKYFPIKNDKIIDFKASNPLTTIVKNGNIYAIHYGNRRLCRLKPEYVDYDATTQSVEFVVDGKQKNVNFGEIINVANNFLVKEAGEYRINVIGYTNKRKKETGINISKKMFLKRYSVDRAGNIFRVEYYNKDKFVGMILVNFKG